MLIQALRPMPNMPQLALALDHALGTRTVRTSKGQVALASSFTFDAVEDLARRIQSVEKILRSSYKAKFDGHANQAMAGVQSTIRYLERRGTATYESLARQVRAEQMRARFMGSNETARGITVMTMHRAKGKEFDIALFFTPEQGRHLGGPSEDRETEESDLMAWHVSVSRAKERLIVFYTGSLISPYLAPLLPKKG